LKRRGTVSKEKPVNLEVSKIKEERSQCQKAKK
jgi:hypothetical protein